MEYTLETLITEFGTHKAEYERNTIKWNADNPTTQRDPQAFVLPAALLTIVTELKTIKDKYASNQSQVSANVSVQEGANIKIPL